MLDAWFNKPVSNADEIRGTEAEVADITPDSSEFVGPDGDVRAAGAAFCPVVDGPRAGIEAVENVDATDSSWESGFDNVSVGTEVGKAPLASLPDVVEISLRPAVGGEAGVTVLDVTKS